MLQHDSQEHAVSGFCFVIVSEDLLFSIFWCTFKSYLGSYCSVGRAKSRGVRATM